MTELAVQRIDVLTDRIVQITLASPAGEMLEPFEPGAHIDFDLGDIGIRSYSLVDFDAAGACPSVYRIAVQLEDQGDGGSRAMHDLSAGDRVSASLPANDFRLHEDNRPALLIAGGIGVTPMISFAARLSALGTPFTFHYATRSQEHCAYKSRLQARFPDHLTLWFDDRRMIDIDGLIGSTSPDAHIYCCGPKGMIEAVRQRAEAAGFAGDRIHFELFASPATRIGDRPFEVEIADGRVFAVPADKTIIEVLEENGVDVLFDCARGDCGICQTDVISGEPDHRDVVLSDSERASGKLMQICVSRAKSPRLVLDI